MPSATDPKDASDIAEKFVKQLTSLITQEPYKQFQRIVEENVQLKRENKDLQTAHRENMKVLAGLQQQASNSEVLDKEIGKLKNCLATLQSSFEGNKEALDKATKKICDLRETIKKKDSRIEDSEKEIKEAKEKLKAEEKNNKALQAELSSARKTMKICSDDLSSLKSFSFPQQNPPRPAICERLHTMFNATLQFCLTFFSNDLDKSILTDPTSLENMRTHTLIKHTIPLPLSNSPAAKQMRIAASLAIISGALSHFIFKPTYLLEQDEELYVMMCRLSINDPAREAYLRSVFLGMDFECEKNRLSLSKRAAKSIFSNVDVMVPEGKRVELREALQVLCERVSKEWKYMQTLVDRVELNEEENDIKEWRVLPSTILDTSTVKATNLLPNNNKNNNNKQNTPARPNGTTISNQTPPSSSSSSSSSATPILLDRNIPDISLKDFKDFQAMLWPPFLICKNGSTELLERGFVLSESQIKAARVEEIAEQGKRRQARDVRRAKTRTMSMNNGDRVTFREDSFLSSTNGDGSKTP